MTRMQLSAGSELRRAAQDQKRGQYFLKGPLLFDFIRRMIPDPTSRVVLVARAFADMKFEDKCVLSGKIWDCAEVSTSQRRRVLARLRKMSPGLIVQDRRGRASVLIFNLNA
jgi:hypothetical protein